MRLLLLVLSMWSGLVSASELANSLLRPVPPLAIQGGRVVNVGTAEQLRAAITGAKDGDIISIADGTYQIVPWMWLKDKKNVTIRGASGDPTKVILKGKGWDQGGDHDNEDLLWIDSSENITIAYVTITEVHAYGLKINADGGPKNINVYNCHFRDIGIRGIKGTKGDSGKSVSKGSVRYCVFENTKIPPASWQFDGDYITGIDMMKLDDWTFADNVFKDIKGHNGQARGAIFVWVESRNITIERNIFINCDRSVSLGNPSNAQGDWNVKDAICRNNVFCTVSPDSAIELSGTEKVKLYNNTIMKKDPHSRGIRVVADSGCKGIEVINNIVCGGLDLGGGTESNNYTGPLDGYFVNPAKFDFRLTASAAGAIGKGVTLKEVKDDGDGNKRRDASDIGAFELGAKRGLTETAQTKGAKTTTASSSDTPKSVAPAAAIDGAAHREQIIKSLQSAEAKTNVKVFVRVFGREEQVRFSSANASGPTIEMDGNALPLTWRDMNESDLIHLALAVRADDVETTFHAGALAAAGKLEDQYKRILDLLFQKDAAKARQLDQLSGRR